MDLSLHRVKSIEEESKDGEVEERKQEMGDKEVLIECKSVAPVGPRYCGVYDSNGRRNGQGTYTWANNKRFEG